MLLYAHSVWTTVAVLLVAALACAAILGWLLRTGLAWRLATDVPNERSLHERPTPRVGGWGVSPVASLAIAFAAPTLWPIAAAALSLAIVSQIDDRRGLPARVRFAAHVAAVCAVLAVYGAALPWWALAMLAFALVWLINLYNFMDGADGLAGGMALFGFGGYALAALVGEHGSLGLALACASVAGAAAGFLRFNFHPARVFLGDAGSIPLGFLAGALGFCGWLGGVWPIWFPVMAFSPFIVDASVTLARRLARGERFWQAHREHYYQRMVRSGLGHRRTALYWYAAMGLGIMLAIGCLKLPFEWQWATFGAWLAALAAAGIAVDVRWRRFMHASAGLK
ncbi:MraY family glycosyltransferase [Trinickia diaoshuihuensis]|uniref:MraY family glycosyltransferase n=1 Tax=Trinickia diaoshuihuensis TaxID=2292265 RepID=UPI000E23FE6A|nr:glycosyltransferase family 4 protein [Trinickia diaoshuihuensis]